MESWFVEIGRVFYVPEKEPDSCPRCGQFVRPERICREIIPAEGGARTCVEVVYQCPRKVCRRFFVALYRRSDSVFDGNEYGQQVGVLEIDSCFPVEPAEPDIPREVKSLSPKFYLVYKEACLAHSLGLKEIAGGGFRKALELLSKDYCVWLHPEQKEEIEKAPLVQCLRDYVTGAEIRACAQRAAWLGNDQLHYLRKWAEHDLEDLRELVGLVIGWICNDIATKRYLGEMPGR